MDDSGSMIPNREAPAGGSPRTPARRPENKTRPLAFLGDTKGRATCRIWCVPLYLGHWAVRLPCEQGRHMPHARCVVEAVVRHAAPAPLHCPAANCGAQHPRRDALKAAVQEGPGLRSRAGRIERRTIGDEDLRGRGLSYGWDQNSLGIRPPLDTFLLDNLRQRFATTKTVQPQLVGTHERLSIHVRGTL